MAARASAKSSKTPPDFRPLFAFPIPEGKPGERLTFRSRSGK